MLMFDVYRKQLHSSVSQMHLTLNLSNSEQYIRRHPQRSHRRQGTPKMDPLFIWRRKEPSRLTTTGQRIQSRGNPSSLLRARRPRKTGSRRSRSSWSLEQSPTRHRQCEEQRRRRQEIRGRCRPKVAQSIFRGGRPRESSGSDTAVSLWHANFYNFQSVRTTSYLHFWSAVWPFAFLI